MKYCPLRWITCGLALCLPSAAIWAASEADSLERAFRDPGPEARPWVFWYWMQASVTREGILLDLEAMAEAGIGGAYLMPIKGPAEPPLMEPVNQLSPEWWGMVRFAFEAADRLGLKLTLHACDGFAVAGGPWITPELSMQKVVWSESRITGGQPVEVELFQPESYPGYYRDIAVFAIPANRLSGVSTRSVTPQITTSQPDLDASFLVKEQTEQRFRSEGPAWIQYAFDSPFTARSIHVIPAGTNFSAKRLRLEVSDDGENFFTVRQLESPRHGWQDGEAGLTYSIPATRARWFRFVHDPEGVEPGCEDLDSAKWKPSLSICGLTLSTDPVIHQFEGKSGAAWRISPPTLAGDVPDFACVDREGIHELTDHLGAGGVLKWNAPDGEWILLRMGHTSTGQTNYIGGAGKGLEADKFNPAAAELQFDKWFGEAIRQVGPELADRVLHGFHVDSWECGSQNWSPVFREAFIEQHGYDPVGWLPAMAGIPLESAEASERFLHDMRETIASLLNTNFFGTMKRLAGEAGVVFSAEAVAPTMVSDGMLHHGLVDIPMGEFWLRSPTHDKPNDMLDAISGGHIYGKNIIQAEAFTELRMAWDEHPGMLKALGDRNLAMGINRFVFHVFTHNPWADRQPGMTLDGVGLYFQRDQTWWKPGRAWLEYLTRCQALLQVGRPVADVAVFTGEELPRRAVLPARLADALPGLIGAERLAASAGRLRNEGQPLRELPKGVRSAANMEDPGDWIDPLSGYAYDSLNRDALLRMATVEEGRICLPGGAKYGLLVIPGSRRMDPQGNQLSVDMIHQLYQLTNDGATILLREKPIIRDPENAVFQTHYRIAELWGTEPIATIGRGRVLRGPWTATTLQQIGLAPMVRFMDGEGQPARGMAWCQRSAPEGTIFFLSNQSADTRNLTASFNIPGMIPERWDPLTGEIGMIPEWKAKDGRTEVALSLAPAQSCFIVFRNSTERSSGGLPAPIASQVMDISGPWSVAFDSNSGGAAKVLTFNQLMDWTGHEDPGIRFYSGTATYENTFTLPAGTIVPGARYFIDLGNVANLAEVILNGQPCGVAWADPMQVEVTAALRPGENRLRLLVTNTWANRLIGDHALEEANRQTWTTAPYRLDGTSLLPSGLSGPVMLLQFSPYP
ncbi:MAG TPA: glycosyl hydrolase [Oceanipulchritudo sp.]|nr:glycosyl hydrolase [Oceanipulchritudo sp.]